MARPVSARGYQARNDQKDVDQDDQEPMGLEDAGGLTGATSASGLEAAQAVT